MVERTSPVPRRGRRQQSPTTAVDAASPAVATVSGAATEAQPTAAQRLARWRPGERNACETPYGRKIKAVEKTYKEETHADVHTISELDRTRNPFSQGRS